jgi:hypothetical protein
MKKSNVLVRLHSDEATQDGGKVRLGDFAPVFHSDDGSSQPRADARKVARDAATEDSGKVRLGDFAPTF